MIIYILLQKRVNKESLGACIKVIKEPVQFFSESLLGTTKVRVTRRPCDVVIRLDLVVVLGLSNERLLELLFVELLGQGYVCGLVRSSLGRATTQLN